MTRRNKLDYFPFFPKDCEADESIRLMDDAQLGFWVRLMCFQWPNGSVPADPDMLRRGVLGTIPGGKSRTVEYVREMMAGPVGQRMQPHPTRDGRLADQRLLKEREIAETLSSRGRRNRNDGEHEDAAECRDLVRTKGQTENTTSSRIASVSVSVSNSNSPLMEQWGEFRSLYPPHRLDEEPAARAFLSRDDEADAIIAGLRVAVMSKEWAESDGKYVPRASKWIFDGGFKDAAKLTPASVSPVTQSTMAPETRRRIEAART